MLFELKNIRVKNGYTQKQVADILDVPLSTYRSWEQLKNNPTLGRMSKLAALFNVDIEALIGHDAIAPNTITEELIRQKEEGAILSDSEQYLVRLYRSSSDENKKIIISIVEILVSAK